MSDLTSHRPPNPRLQRTPLRAPLSRKPLGRVVSSVLVVAAAICCDFDDHWRGVNVSGMEEWRGATVSIDGSAVGKLDYLMTHDTWFEKWMKRKGDSPMFHVVSLNVPFDLQRAKAGTHQVSVAKPGGAALTLQITYPDPRGDVTFLSINGDHLEDNTATGTHP